MTEKELDKSLADMLGEIANITANYNSDCDNTLEGVKAMNKELQNLESLMFGGIVQDTPKDGIAWRVFDAVMELKKERDDLQKELSEIKCNNFQQ